MPRYDLRRMADGVVYVVDDDAGVRRALCRLLSSVGLHAEAFRSVEAFLRSPLPDQHACLVLDLRLGNDQSGLDLQAHLGDKQSTIPIIFITGFGTVRDSVRAMKAGAFDFLEKPIDDEALLTRVQDALALSRQNTLEEAERKLIESRLARLTHRERQVLWLVVRGGVTNSQIGAELGMAEKTVKIHRGQITRKMRADSVAALVRMVERLSMGQVQRLLGEDAAAAMTTCTKTRSASS